MGPASGSGWEAAMKIAILSDTHGRHGPLTRALQEVRRRGVGVVIHCGDIEDPQTVLLFRGLDAHFVFGNCDFDRDGIRQAAAQAGVTVHEDFGHLERDGVRIAFVHGDDHALLRELEDCGQYDFIFHGHTHVAAEHRSGPTRVINPGALHRARSKTFAVLDLRTSEVESVVVKG
jgi:putative phosphoesterase